MVENFNMGIQYGSFKIAEFSFYSILTLFWITVTLVWWRRAQIENDDKCRVHITFRALGSLTSSFRVSVLFKHRNCESSGGIHDIIQGGYQM